jgi:hypothetical protein
MSETIENWLKKLEIDIRELVKSTRRFHSYVGEVICNTDKFYIWKKGGRNTVENRGNTTIIKLAPFQSESVHPISIRFDLDGDWVERFEDRHFVDMSGIGRSVTAREEQIVAETLMIDSKAFNLDSEVCKLDGLREAIGFIETEGNFADTLLINPLQTPKLMCQESFISKWSLPAEYPQRHTFAFVGLLGHLLVYETVGLSQTTALLYQKNESRVRKTPLSVKFDDYSHPRKLAVGEDLFAWTVDWGAMAKITLRT